MLNIDVSFIKNSKLDSEVENINFKYTELYKSKVIDNIKRIDEQSVCDDCDIDLSATTDVDLRNIIEVYCKGTIGKHFCQLPESMKDTQLSKDKLILIKLQTGTEIGTISEFGAFVILKRRKLGLCGEEIPTVLRLATEPDIEQYNNNIRQEVNAKKYFLERIQKYNLIMKLVDVHYQFDKQKLYFYFTADGRVDFRDLVKDLASEFRTRIELRQIGVRDEAKRVGGLGACGREYCCSSFIVNFKKITTQIATEQNLTTYLSKHSGPCGKLKCCLSFEVD